MTKFLFDKTAGFDELRKCLPPSAKFTKEFSTVDKDLDRWNVIAWSETELPDDCEERFIDMLYMKVFPVK
jgi:hypothetical protein